MYSERAVEAAVGEVERKTGVKLVRYEVARCVEITAHLGELMDDDGKMRRQLRREEQEFIRNEQLLCSVDFMYWALRYVRIKGKRPGPPQLYVPWQSQRMLHEKMSKVQETCVDRNDGIMIANCKARQTGMSTVYEAVITHKAIYTYGYMGLIAADEPGQSEYLFNMMERIYDNLPWWGKPDRQYHVKGYQMKFGKLDSLIVVQHGSLKADIGRGKTPHGCHLSELEKWEDTAQIDDGLLPALPRMDSTMAFFESTGELRNSWWHKFFTDALGGKNRFEAFFVPWYVEDQTYWRPAPEGWEPDDITKQHMSNVERDSVRWCGKRVELSKNQAYFWEFTRKEFQRRGNLGVFYCEYASTPEEAFRTANRSVFDYDTMEMMRSKATYPKEYIIKGPDIDSDKLGLDNMMANRIRA